MGSCLTDPMKYSQIKYTWIETPDVEKYTPITQVYGIVFNDNGEILICRESKDGKWIIPGGHPEKGESLEDTLKREVSEEVDIEVLDIKPLGVVKVEFSDDLGKVIYQSRFIAKFSKFKPQTPDPANGKTWERKFIPVDKITEYVKWGEIGDAMFKKAIKVWESRSYR